MIDDPQRLIPGHAGISGLQLLESCAFTWIFDGATRRFRRLPREARVSLGVPMDWMPYHRLEIDGPRSCFVVVLDEDGTRILRVWLHAHPCVRCSPDQLGAVDRPLAGKRAGRHPLRPFGGWVRTEGGV